MVKVMAPIAAVILYIPVFYGHLEPTIIGSVVIVTLGVISCCLGLTVNYRRPRLAAFAIGGWTVASIVVLASACVVAAWLGVWIKDASPGTASGPVKIVAALAAAALATLLGWLLDNRPMLTGGGIAKGLLQKQLKAWFPSQPQAPREAIVASEAVSDALFRTDAKEWGLQFRYNLFQTVKAAIDVGGYKDGPAWRDAESARQSPDVAAVVSNLDKPPAAAPPAPPPNIEG